MFEAALGIILIAFIWICFGVIGGGYYFAYLQTTYPELAELQFGLDCELARRSVGLGPILLVTVKHNVGPNYAYLFGKKAR